jgi:hypothetical protein
MAIKTGGGVIGGACVVNSGPNKGKKGTYTVDENGQLWCEGPWGGTECGDGKCADARPGLPLYDRVDIVTGERMLEVQGSVQVEDGEVVHVRAIFGEDHSVARQITIVTIPLTQLSALRDSEAKVDRVIARAIDSRRGRDAAT